MALLGDAPAFYSSCNYNILIARIVLWFIKFAYLKQQNNFSQAHPNAWFTQMHSDEFIDCHRGPTMHKSCIYVMRYTYRMFDIHMGCWQNYSMLEDIFAIILLGIFLNIFWEAAGWYYLDGNIRTIYHSVPAFSIR